MAADKRGNIGRVEGDYSNDCVQSNNDSVESSIHKWQLSRSNKELSPYSELVGVAVGVGGVYV